MENPKGVRVNKASSGIFAEHATELARLTLEISDNGTDNSKLSFYSHKGTATYKITNTPEGEDEYYILSRGFSHVQETPLDERVTTAVEFWLSQFKSESSGTYTIVVEKIAEKVDELQKYHNNVIDCDADSDTGPEISDDADVTSVACYSKDSARMISEVVQSHARVDSNMSVKYEAQDNELYLINLSSEALNAVVSRLRDKESHASNLRAYTEAKAAKEAASILSKVE